MAKEMNKEMINVGDIVGVAREIQIGFYKFRYQMITPKKVVRVTPKRTKIFVEGDAGEIEIGRREPLYLIDEETMRETKIAKCVENLNYKFFEIEDIHRKTKWYHQLSDEELIDLEKEVEKVLKMFENIKKEER